jgi:hypothetical protein
MFKFLVFGEACCYGNNDRQCTSTRERTMTHMFTALFPVRFSPTPCLHRLEAFIRSLLVDLGDSHVSRNLERP